VKPRRHPTNGAPGAGAEAKRRGVGIVRRDRAADMGEHARAEAAYRSWARPREWLAWLANQGRPKPLWNAAEQGPRRTPGRHGLSRDSAGSGSGVKDKRASHRYQPGSGPLPHRLGHGRLQSRLPLALSCSRKRRLASGEGFGGER